ncbi:hypothetical protein [Marinobacter caseinilyticus]|uniref:hypothetical protein n=1 Tax=Marinobacter caseinilyticus TaxID=2692195 RepID=UPI0014084712|nr:hypothetical protein [Marinobacter caseinilyticus]
MSTFRYYAIVFACFMALIGWSAGAFSDPWNGDAEVCSQSAKTVYQSCQLGVAADATLATANCFDQPDPETRRACFVNVKTEVGEERELCREQRGARLDVCDLVGEGRYQDPLSDPNIVFVHPDDIGVSYPKNAYVDLAVGHTYVLRAGEDFEETVVVHVTDQIREAEGFSGPVYCRVVVDVVLVAEQNGGGESEWVAAEVTDDYLAQDEEGNVYYCGEIARNFENGFLDNLDGSFFTGLNGAKAGVLLRQNPMVGQVDRQEYALNEAEDVVEYLALDAAPDVDEGGQNPNAPEFQCAGNGMGDCLMTRDFSALSPGDSEFKFYKKEVGFVLAVALEDGEFTGEREELVCVGESLDVLNEPACGIDNPEELLDNLCALSPLALCQ